jgi:hypothetical protein
MRKHSGCTHWTLQPQREQQRMGSVTRSVDSEHTSQHRPPLSLSLLLSSELCLRFGMTARSRHTQTRGVLRVGGRRRKAVRESPSGWRRPNGG